MGEEESIPAGFTALTRRRDVIWASYESVTGVD